MTRWRVYVEDLQPDGNWLYNQDIGQEFRSKFPRALQVAENLNAQHHCDCRELRIDDLPGNYTWYNSQLTVRVRMHKS